MKKHGISNERLGPASPNSAHILNKKSTTIITLAGLAGLLLTATSTQASLITSEAWDADPSTSGQVDWSGGSANFTHAINFMGPDITFTAADGYGLTGAETLTFYGASGNTFSGPGGSGSLNARSGRPHNHTKNPGDFTIDNAAGTQAITRGFRYNGPTSTNRVATLQVDGLNTNTQYELVLYQATTFGGNPSTLAFTNTGAGSSGDDSLAGVNRGGNKVSVIYTTGTNTSVSLTTTRDPGTTGTWHWYAFSNVVIVPEPSTTIAIAMVMVGSVFRRRRRRRLSVG